MLLSDLPMKTDLRLKPRVWSTSSTRGTTDIFGIGARLRRLVKILHMVTSSKCTVLLRPCPLLFSFLSFFFISQRLDRGYQKRKGKESGAETKKKVLNLVPESSNL